MATASDSSGQLNSSDYLLNYLVLTTSEGITVDIKGLMVELNLYEDLFSPVMTGDILLGDALDLISSYAMHGNEWLQLSIDKPSLNMPIVKTFRIYKIGNRSLGSNGLQNYRMHFCSEELFLSTQNLVAKSYKGMAISTIVNDLLLNKLFVQPSKINVIDQTSGVWDIIIPRMSALEAIAWLCPRSYGPNKNLWLFFENRDGFNFVAYETLLAAPTYQTYTYNITIDQDNTKNINTFLVLNVVQDFDIMKASRAGAFSSTLSTFDIINRQYTSTNFNVTQLANNATLNGTLPSNAMVNRLGQTVYSTTENMLKFAIITDSDPTCNPARLNRWLPQTISRLGQLNTFKMVGVIPGDILVKAGMMVNVNIPKQEIQDGASSNEPFRSGRYIISSVHHKFINDIASTVIEMMSDSMATALPGPGVTSPTIQAVVQQ